MIVGLAGYARVGKHEAARGLEAIGYTTVAFADVLREMLYILDPLVDGHGHEVLRLSDIIDKYGWDGYKETEYAGEIRRLIQTLGTDCGRNLLGDSIWIDATLKNDSENIVVADVRFPNEAQAIKDRGGMIIRINKPYVGPANDHASELSLEDWPYDVAIMNSGTVNDLHRKVRKVVAIFNVRT